MVIGVTDEDPALVDAWVAQHKPKYPIAILGSGDFEDGIGLEYFPYAAVIAPDGALIYTGSAGNYRARLDGALADATQGSVSPKALAKATKLMQSGALDRSYGEVLKVLEAGKLEGRDLAQAEHFRDFLEGRASAALEAARDLQERLVYQAVALIEPFADASPPFPATAGCEELLAELRALPDYKREMKGGAAYAKALELRAEKEFTRAAEAFRTINRKYDGTRVATSAVAAARDLMEQRLIGYKPHCGTCKRLKRACSKHSEEFKL